MPKPKTLDVAKAVERLNELSSGSRRNLRFRVDESSGRTIITVINAVTKEIVRQIPPEELLAIAATLEQSGGHDRRAWSDLARYLLLSRDDGFGTQ